jgi:hypothetical protein
MSAVQQLSRAEKLQLLHELLDDVATPDRDVTFSAFFGGADIISPIPAPEAAAALQAMLAQGEQS